MSKGLERYFEYLRQDDTDILLGSKISDSLAFCPSSLLMFSLSLFLVNK